MQKNKVPMTWFVWGDPQANEVISKNLAEMSDESQKGETECILLSKKKASLQLWNCELSFIHDLVVSQRGMGFAMKVFTRRGVNGQVKEVPRWLYDDGVKKPKKAKLKNKVKEGSGSKQLQLI